MGENSKIEWTDDTFNTWWGCTEVSPACDECYARILAHRYGHEVWGKDAPRRFFGDAHWNEPLKWNRRAAESGKRERVFCGSMCDVMEDRGDLHDARLRLYELIDDTRDLDWLLTSKRPQNFERLFPFNWLQEPMPNVWLLTTVENQDFEWRIKAMLRCPAVVHGISAEPLVGPLNLPQKFLDLGKRGWVITGGESGAKPRPSDPRWFQHLRDQCVEAGVPFFFKQWGEWAPTAMVGFGGRERKAHHVFSNGDGTGVEMIRVGKKEAGRLLEGVEWSQFPEVNHA